MKLFRYAIFITSILAAQAANADDQSSPSAEKPRATLSAFSSLPREITFPKLIQIVGESRDDIGSGIHIYRYRLGDGTTVLVGTPDRKQIIYVTHVSGEVRARLFPSGK